MKIVQINSYSGIGSTGRICEAVSSLLWQYGIENYVLYAQSHSSYKYAIKYTSRIYTKSQALLERITGAYGFNAKRSTRNLIQHLERIRPDIVHLHVLHSHECNIEMLCNYLSSRKIKTLYTFHDCWAFTGYCPYFDMAKCEQWKTACDRCPLKRNFSWFVDRSRSNFDRKKKALLPLDLTIITPSRWLAGLVKESFLKGKNIVVINNGIDLRLFQPILSDDRYMQEYDQKFIILGVAHNWEYRKGLDVFVELAKRLDNQYQIILVGIDDKTKAQLPKNIVALRRTQSSQELAKLYSRADLFVNPTREDNFPTTNIEALACGTPVVTFNTGGSPEMLDSTCGSIVPQDDINALCDEIVRINEMKPYSREACRKKALEYDMNAKFMAYVDLYRL